VVCVIPTFKWSTSKSGSTTVQKRIGRGLRVYVRRPWFMSGNDERLGIVLGRDEAAIVAKPQYLSIWGDDPTWFDRGKLNPLTRSQLVPPTITPIPDIEMGPAVLTEVNLPNTNTLVDVVTAEPVFNRERDLWYFDFEFETLNTYFPFVRLALARVQYKSIPGCVLSEVVRADFAQLVADRTLSVIKNANGSLGITVAGIVGSNEVWSAQSASTQPKRSAPEAAKGHLVEAQLQTTLNARKDALDWANVGLPVQLAAHIAPANSGGANLTFEGTLTPDPNRQRNAGYRILVKEYETYGSDASKRLVYSGTYDLPDN
jgi:hypothetical protein